MLAMLRQRRINVDATSRRCIDVDPTLYKRHMPAGMFSPFLIPRREADGGL